MSNPTSPAAHDPSWRLALDAGLRVWYWDDECVVWHGASGDTHRLPQAIGQLLERLQQSPASAAVLSSAIDLHQDDVDAALVALKHLRIVEEVPLR